jgi:aldose 1-epimerase
MSSRSLRALPAASLFFCFASFLPAQSPHLPVKPWGKAYGQPVSLYTLKNSSGMEVTITNYGGTVTQVLVPDRNKNVGDVVLGFDNIDGYTSKTNNGYFGALIGRYANRLAHGTFSLDGHEYHIPTNEGANMLHGGTRGFDKRIWEAKDVSSPGTPALQLHYLSPDGEEGFPGALSVTVTYRVNEKNELRIDYEATTTKDTVLNLTNHTYFNLSGPGSGSILDDSIMLAADQYTPVDKTLIPTGAISPVAGTPFDFRKSTVIGSRIGAQNEQLKFANGYDQNFVLNHPAGSMGLAARVDDPKSGRVLEVYTDQPGIQFYTGNFLNGTVHGIGGVYRFRSALALETQHFPDSPNHPNFPSTELKPGETFHSSTIWKFSTK